MIRSFNHALLPLSSVAPDSSPLRRIAPLPKVVFLAAFLILTVSLGRYDWMGAALFSFLPLLFSLVGGVSPWRIFIRMAAAWPFVLCAGIANCFFDRTPVEWLPGLTTTGGVVSLAVLIGKTTAAIGMTLLLAASTPMSEMTGALARLHVPRILILQLQFMFRYLGVLVEEARNASNAYFLRNPHRKRIPVRDWGALIGRLFLRTVQRANAVHAAMQCRLFRLDAPLPRCAAGGVAEWTGVLLLLSFLVCARCIL